MATGTSVKFDASHHAVVVLLGLGAILVLPLARMPLLKLYWQPVASVLPSCVCYLVHLGPHLYSKSSCVRITAVGQPPAMPRYWRATTHTHTRYQSKSFNVEAVILVPAKILASKDAQKSREKK